MIDQVNLQMVKDLKSAAKKSSAAIWYKLAKFALRSRYVRRVVNINKIDKLTKENDRVICPYKVLGMGTISHKITLFSFGISNSAASKIVNSGGRIVSHLYLINEFPTGKGIIIIG